MQIQGGRLKEVDIYERCYLQSYKPVLILVCKPPIISLQNIVFHRDFVPRENIFTLLELCGCGQEVVLLTLPIEPNQMFDQSNSITLLGSIRFGSHKKFRAIKPNQTFLFGSIGFNCV